MRRILSFVFALCALCGCSASNDTVSTITSTPTAKISDQYPLLVDSGFFYGDGYSNYYVELFNPNTDQWIAAPEFTLTCYDDDGFVILSETSSVLCLANQQTVYASIPVDTTGIHPSTYSIDISGDLVAGEIPEAHTLDLEVKNVSEVEAMPGMYRVLGEIQNNSDTDIDWSNSMITILFKNGDDIVGSGFVTSSILSGETGSFEYLTSQDFPEHDSVEVYPYGWNLGILN